MSDNNALMEAVRAAWKARRNIEEEKALRQQVATTGQEQRDTRRLFRLLSDYFFRLVRCERASQAQAKAILELQDRVKKLERMLMN